MKAGFTLTGAAMLAAAGAAPAAGAGAAASITSDFGAATPGMFSFWPIRIRSGLSPGLAATMEDIFTLYFLLMDHSCSPRLTVWTIGAAASAAGAVAAGAAGGGVTGFFVAAGGGGGGSFPTVRGGGDGGTCSV